MKRKNILSACLLICLLPTLCFGKVGKVETETRTVKLFPWVAVGLLGAGIAMQSLDVDNPLFFSKRGLQTEIQNGVSFQTSIDDYIQYFPVLAGAALHLLGQKPTAENGWHFYGNLAGTLAVTGVLVWTVKYSTAVTRPDGGKNAFYSGHTALAFSFARWLHREYPTKRWWVLGGYLTAAATGVLRVTNNRHWVSDVLAGAGAGILSVDLTYWLKKQLLSPKGKKQDIGLVISPAGFSLQLLF